MKFLQRRYGSCGTCGADCGETRAPGFSLLSSGVRMNTKQQQQQQQQQRGLIHHLVSYMVTDSRVTGYGIMKLSSSVECLVLWTVIHPKCEVVSEKCTFIALVRKKLTVDG